MTELNKDAYNQQTLRMKNLVMQIMHILASSFLSFTGITCK